MDDPPPPIYAARPPVNPAVVDDRAGPAPPQYSFPQSFNIGTRRTPPLVDSTQLKGHLALLRSFALLRSQVDELSGNAVIEDKDRRWAWFVSLAVERWVIVGRILKTGSDCWLYLVGSLRFAIWCQKLTEADMITPAHEVLPPLDVIMVRTCNTYDRRSWLHGLTRFGMPTCLIRGLSVLLSIPTRRTMLNIPEGGMRRTVPDSPASMYWKQSVGHLRHQS